MVEFWFEFASTYSYPAAMTVEELARQYDQELVWRPFLLGPIFRDQGWSDSPFKLFEAKGRYMWRDVERVCEAMRLPFRKPSSFPRHSVLAARVACSAQSATWLPEYVRRVYRAEFSQDLDIAEPSVIAECLKGLVKEPAAQIAAASQDAIKNQLRANTDRARALGIFGAPTVVVGSELFWGNDRLETAFEWARRLAERR